MVTLIETVIVIGGGIAGIQTSLDLAEAGVHVILVEKQSSIGGKMAALDKNFPTLDCSICIEAPKMSEVMKHPNIDVRTMTEVIQVDGEVGNFAVKLKEKARYINDECTRCGECSLACPQILPNEFDYGIGYRKGIYTSFQQSEPGAYVIDMDVCLNNPPNYIPCNRCVDACLPKCIDFDAKPSKEYEEKAKSIIVATGFDLLNPALLKEYGYGTHPDVLTSIEYERILNSAGPTTGVIVRPSTLEKPESILFIQCVGSRDQRLCPYCSRVCCMYTSKEAIQSIDHGIKNVTILYIDIRAFGKGFDEFYQRSIEEGVRYIRGRPAKIDTSNDKLIITYENTNEMKIEKEEFDLVVLASALLPSKGTADLAEVLKLELDSDGFIKTNETQELQVGTTRPGIYVCGCSSGPKDIPDSVTEASAAAAAAMTHIDSRFWPKEEFEETISPDGDPKIGVFVCDCGSNIAGVADVPDIVKYAEKLDGVVHSEELMFACAGTTQASISEVVKEKGINRLVIAACSPKTHNPTFQRVCMHAGLNKYLLEMSNIRNLNTWVHKKNPVEATEKSKDMVRMAVEKAKLLTPLKEIELPIVKRALVVGGGIAGIVAATNLSQQGFETHLVETTKSLGGMLKKIDKLAPSGTSAKVLLEKLTQDLESSGAHIHLNTTVETISGTVGNFHTHLTDGSSLDVGAIILSYGSNAYIPSAFGYKEKSNVITNIELEENLETRKEKNITFLSCVGSRSESIGCSRYCCQNMIYQAIRLRDLGKNVTVLYKDIRTFSRHAEEMYYEACKRGVLFIQYPDSYNPEKDVIFKDEKIIIKDELLGEKVAIPTDLLVLVLGLHPPKDHSVADLLKISKTEDDFLLELHPKLAPLEAAVHGVFLAGTVRGPVLADEAVSQGLGAAAKAVDLMAKGRVIKEPFCANINPTVCTGCHLCAKVCPYNAIEGEVKEPHQVIEAACVSCGTCAGECPVGAITMPGFTDEQILRQIDAALLDQAEKKIIVFTCNWCSYAGADQAGIAKIQYPSSSRIIRTMCSGRISRKFIERAFEKGAGAVLMTGCRLTEKGSDCHYNYANVQTRKRFEKWKKWVKQKGIDPKRLQLQWVSASEGKILAQKLNEMEEVLDHYNKNPKIRYKKSTSGGA